jgi:signal transduction histidine kinase
MVREMKEKLENEYTVELFEEINKELLQKFEKQLFFSMTTFISGVTHEFRTPIQTIRSGLDLLKEKYKDDCKIINIICDSTEHISDMVENLTGLGMHKSEIKNSEEKHIGKKINISIKEELINILDLIKISSIYKEILIENVVLLNCKKDFNVFIPSYIFRNIIINLINNSIKAVKVRKKENEEFIPKIYINIYELEGDIVIEVEDNGIGIGEEHKEHIFSPFFRANRNIPGTGMGLFISQFWAKKLGIDLVLKSSELGKTVFSILLNKQNFLEHSKQKEDMNEDNFN